MLTDFVKMFGAAVPEIIVLAIIMWLTHTKMVSVITRGASDETSSHFSPSPSHNISPMSYHACRGAAEFRANNTGATTTPKCYGLPNIAVGCYPTWHLPDVATNMK